MIDLQSHSTCRHPSIMMWQNPGFNADHKIYWPMNLPLLTTSLLSCMATLWADRSAADAPSAAAAALLLLTPSPAPSPAKRSSRSRSSLD